ncbi:DUF423 domain-containing protein [Methylocella sp.]|uniref:DUF423 domain-containing protein n=1 Tax=Methylocella sp. TaxID=1978226 RepID=UPI0037838C73
MFSDAPAVALTGVALSGALGAFGVILSAVGAHADPNPVVVTAAHFLLVNALALLGLGALLMAAPGLPGFYGFALAGALLFLGAALFCGDLSARAFLGARLFPMAAPTGGALMISGWILVAGAAIYALARRNHG